MKGWRITAFGIENLEAFEAPVPKAKAEQVVLKIHAVSLNYRDLMTVRGGYNPKLALPRIPCSDGAGEIVEVGEDVTGLAVGDRVCGIFMQRWLDGPPTNAKHKAALGGDVDGMLAEYVALDATGVVRFPEHLSYEEASTLPCAGVTAWNAVVSPGELKAGDTMVIQGTGGVSLFALQFGKIIGARVLGTSSSDEKLERAKALGLDAGVNYKAQPKWADWVLVKTDGEGAKLVVEVGGAGTLGQSIQAVQMGGTIAQIGVLTQSKAPLEIGPILRKHAYIHGIYVGSKADFEAMNRAITEAGLKPVIDAVMEFGEARAALQRMQDASHFGKIVIKVSA